MVLFLIGVLFLVVSYKSNNPITSAITFIVSIVIQLPLLSVQNIKALLYLTIIVFVSGVFVLIVYFSSLSFYWYNYISLSVLILLFVLFLLPFCVYCVDQANLFSYFNYESFVTLVGLIFLLLNLMLSTSYLLDVSLAIRRL